MMERSTEAGMAHIKGLHHNAYRCRDSEETRAWYEDFLGLKLVSAFPIDEGRALHTFFQMDDGFCLAFFEVPGKPFDFKRQDSLDLHIALGVDNDVFERMLQKGRARAIEVRGPVDHGFCRSIYLGLTRFGGHPESLARGAADAKNTSTVFAGVSPTDG